MTGASSFYQKIPPACRFNFYCRTFHVLTKSDSPTTKPWHFTHNYAKCKQHRLAFHRYQAFCPATLNAGSSVPSPDRQVTQRPPCFASTQKKTAQSNGLNGPFPYTKTKASRVTTNKHRLINHDGSCMNDHHHHRRSHHTNRTFRSNNTYREQNC